MAANLDTTRADVFASLSSEIPFVCMPLANSTHGAVIETLDSFRSDRWSNTAFIRDEITLKVEHCLVIASPKGEKEEKNPSEILESIVRVYSHEQALGQCAGWLGQHLPQAKRVKTESTAAAASRLIQQTNGETTISQPMVGLEAAICSEMCLQTQAGLRLLRKNIQDRDGAIIPNCHDLILISVSDNQTRFAIVGYNCVGSPPFQGSCDKVSTRTLLRVSPRKDKFGSVLSSISTESSLRSLVIERIDRRPALDGDAWSDVYFIELSHGPAVGLEEGIRGLLGSLQPDSNVIVLGIW